MNQKQLVKIVAVSVDTKQAVLYHIDGSTTTWDQGDSRLPGVVEHAKEGIPAYGFIMVDIGEPMAKRGEFNDVEQGTGGLIKFFKVAKKAVSEFFAPSPTKVTETAHVRPVDIGVKPGEEPVAEEPTPVVQINADVVVVADSSVTDIPALAQAVAEATKPTNDKILDQTRDRMNALIGTGSGTDTPEFHKRLQEDETIVAVNTETGAILPEAQSLVPQFKIAAKLQNYKGIENFMKRLEPVLTNRRHSAADLMKFLEKGDLPIADDGCIVIFKRLERKDGHYVDCHTRNVRQKVGSFVFMREGLVDPNRRQDCSNGLHVASLSYLSGFSGNVTIIGKVRPEDVFAVPEYNTNKMRVCGYHILGELPKEVRDTVNRGGAIDSIPEGKIILENVLRGNHTGVTQYVEIGGNRGANLTIKDVEGAEVVSLTQAVEVVTAETLDTSIDVRGEAKVNKITEAPIKATDLVKPVEKTAVAEAKPEEVKPATKASGDKYQATFNEMVGAFAADFPEKAARLAQQLVDAKKKAKKSWEKLGFDEGDVQAITDCLAHKTEAPLAEQKDKPVAVAPKEAKAPAKSDALDRKKIKAKSTHSSTGTKPMTVKEEAQDLYRIFKDTKAKGNRADTVDAAQELQSFMSSRKKGPKAFGLDAKVSEELKLWLK